MLKIQFESMYSHPWLLQLNSFSLGFIWSQIPFEQSTCRYKSQGFEAFRFNAQEKLSGLKWSMSAFILSEKLAYMIARNCVMCCSFLNVGSFFTNLQLLHIHRFIIVGLCICIKIWLLFQIFLWANPKCYFSVYFWIHQFIFQFLFYVCICVIYPWNQLILRDKFS